MSRRNAAAAVEDHVGVLILQAHETAAGGIRVGIALDAHLALFIEREVIVRRNDQIRLVVAANLVQPQRQHQAFDGSGGRGDRAATLQRSRRRLNGILPERPSSRVDAADSARSGIGNQRLETIDLIRQRTIRIQIVGEVVLESPHRVLDTGLCQLHNRVAAGVSPQFQTTRHDVQGDLTPLIFRCGNHVRLLDIQNIVAGVALVSPVRVVVKRLGNGQTTIFLPGLALFRQTLIQRVVVRDVVLHILRVVTPGSGDQLGEG